MSSKRPPTRAGFAAQPPRSARAQRAQRASSAQARVIVAGALSGNSRGSTSASEPVELTAKQRIHRQEDCGVCANCLDKPKFGGNYTRRQACKLKLEQLKRL